VAAITVENISIYSQLLNAGTNLTNVNYSIFLGVDTGYSATSANNKFHWYQAGYSATSASNSNFIGYQAGYNATVLTQISGYQAGIAQQVFGSNLFGTNTGDGAKNAYYSNFMENW
jgi:hypothetical protein